ncbi:MAG TPA: hypothetical protein V6C58_03545 [Allocoleopsis sp.]
MKIEIVGCDLEEVELPLDILMKKPQSIIGFTAIDGMCKPIDSNECVVKSKVSNDIEFNEALAHMVLNAKESSHIYVFTNKGKPVGLFCFAI